jgi:hypothetical protein
VRNQLELDPLQLTVAHADLHINHFKDQLRNLEERNGQLLVRSLSVTPYLSSEITPYSRLNSRLQSATWP